ncbi:MAG: hypothetical protein ABT27_11845 [Lysobacteraceae bacterium SCN 69-25]|nr:MAG: hypothetical protein ABT27_11845 [Xanthomonadaceae bacterium SCN 69-25]
MRLALDTNLLVYAEGEGDAMRCGLARALTQRLPVQRVVLPMQVLGELHHVLARKFRWPAARVGDRIGCGGAIQTGCDTVLIGLTPQGRCLQSASDEGSAFVQAME